MIRRALLPFLVVPSLLAPAGAQNPAPPASTDVSFRVFVRGIPLGSETVSVTKLSDGWRVMSIGQLAAPISFTTRKAEVVYDGEWRPRSLFIDSTLKDQVTTVKTAFAGGKATSEVVQNGQTFQKADEVAEKTIVLPNLIFGLYESLAAQVSAVAPGTTFRVYVAPQAEIDVKLESAAAERVSAPGRVFEARRHRLTFQQGSGPLTVDLWTDGPRLMRITIPSVPIDVIRDDVASVASRATAEYRVNDEDVRAAGNGFNLAGTLSKPAAAAAAPAPAAKPALLPAVVLVPGSGPQDRDESIAGVPVYAQLAGALADAGYLVVRYDKRGLGQSGGRAESTTLLDYAEDVRAVVKFLERRKDVDRKRVALVGYGDGGAIALVAAQREKKITAVALVAAPGTTGAEALLEQQQQLLDRSKTPDTERAAKIELQKKVIDAVLTGKGWEEVPADLRKQAETPWFRSFLEYDPAKVVPRTRQPLFIARGESDATMPPHHADKLAALAGARKNAPPPEVVSLPALTADGRVSADLVSRLVAWLGKDFGK
jgi:pimeloyl-ACP methyl ester carboxylesterase